MMSPTPSLTTDQRLFTERIFSSPSVKPAEEIQWNTRSVNITDDVEKKVIFQQDHVEAPKDWSDMAVKVVASKYFYGQHGSPQRETSVKSLVYRVCHTIADWGLKDNYFADEAERVLFEDELTWLCLNQHAAFNSPVWFNVGLWQCYGVGGQTQGNWRYDVPTQVVARCQNQFEHPQSSACFICSVDDTMESIMQLATTEAMLFKYGSGTGTNLSSIRSSRERLSGGGRPSGPLSFLRIYDQVGNVVKSGGRTRRAAKMNVIDDWHGDVEEFIMAKALEEKKARALIDAGFDGSFNGEVYRNTLAFQNENLSIRVSDEFMEAAMKDGEWWTKSVQTGENLEKKSAKDLLNKIADSAWLCGDPGLQFTNTITRWHTCKGTEPIHCTNPCAEYVFLDNTACNLSSLNLMKFKRPDGVFDVERFSHAVRLLITAQEILVDNASYPTPDIAENSHIFRTLGLGYANLGALIMSYGLPYDSDEGRALAASITALMTAEAYRQSATLAEVRGPFAGYLDAKCAHVPKPTSPDNMDAMHEVIKLHALSMRDVPVYPVNIEIRSAACKIWGELASGQYKETGYRNAQVTVLAPTGTIAFMMDCDTTGIEPDIALVKYKLLAGGGMLHIVNQTVTEALTVRGYDPVTINVILAHIDRYDTIEDQLDATSGLDPKDLPIFDCAFKPSKGQRSILPIAHLKMMAAAQPFVSGSISKTVNLPNNCTRDDIYDAYVEAWKLGLKCVAVYRDGSKMSQPLNTSKKVSNGHVGHGEVEALKRELLERKDELIELWDRVDDIGRPVRHRLPDTRRAVTHKFDIGGHEGYMTVGLFEDGSPGELFVTMSKEGSTVSGLMDCIGTLTSMALQYGVPLDALANKFSYVRFDPSGYTRNPEIKHADSVIDYVFRWLGQQFSTTPQNGHRDLPVRVPARVAVLQAVTSVTYASMSEVAVNLQSDAPACPTCGSITIRAGACYKCANCGDSLGCS